MNISSALKTKLSAEVASGNTVYTPSRSFTYGSWTGMVYISLDPNTGSASYTIGEGLNGGYTVSALANYLRDLFATNRGYTLEYSVFLPNASVRQGSILTYTINYVLKLLGAVVGTFSEKTNVNTANLPLGPYPIKSQYVGATTTQNPVPTPAINTKCYFGTTHCEYDDTIKNYATINGIPGDLIKSMIHQESYFDAQAYRYEAHVDYDWYSQKSSTIPRGYGWVGMFAHPEKHFTISGTNGVGETIPQGDQAPSKKTVLEWSTHMSGYPNGLDTSADTDGELTAQELLDKNPDRYWKAGKATNEDWNFTAQ